MTDDSTPSDTERGAVSFIDDQAPALPSLPEPYLSAQAAALLLGPNVTQPLYTAGQLAAAVAAAVERCAKWVDARRDAFCEEHGSIDPDTGCLEFGRGDHAQAKDEYVGELEEIAAGLRSLAENQGRAAL